MFSVYGMPGIDIPIPDRQVLQEYLDGKDARLKAYLRGYLYALFPNYPSPLNKENRVIEVDVEVVRAYLGQTQDRVDTVVSVLLEVLHLDREKRLLLESILVGHNPSPHIYI